MSLKPMDVAKGLARSLGGLLRLSVWLPGVLFVGVVVAYFSVMTWHFYVLDKHREWGERLMAKEALLSADCRRQMNADHNPNLFIKNASHGAIARFRGDLGALLWGRHAVLRRSALTLTCEQEIAGTFEHSYTEQTLTIHY